MEALLSMLALFEIESIMILLDVPIGCLNLFSLFAFAIATTKLPVDGDGHRKKEHRGLSVFRLPGVRLHDHGHLDAHRVLR